MLCAHYTLVKSIVVLELVKQGGRSTRIVTLQDFHLNCYITRFPNLVSVSVHSCNKWL